MKKALLTDWKYYYLLYHSNISVYWKWLAWLCWAGDSRWHGVPVPRGNVGLCVWNEFCCSWPRQVSSQRWSWVLHILAEASAEGPVLDIHSKRMDLKCGFILAHSSNLILGCFFFLEETILLLTYHLPQVSEMYIFLSNIKFYSVFCDKYQWDTESGVVLALVCDMGPRLVRKPAIWYPLKISTPKLS